ncbi:hypothetical protein PACTADRAFT_23999, partial [Pachysolen tannophilus NRRL Y-2460]
INDQNDLIQATSKNPTAVLELDMDCKVKFLSRNWESIVGTKITKIVNKPVSRIVVADSDFDKEVFRRAVDIMMADDTSYRVKFLAATDDVPGSNEGSIHEDDNDSYTNEFQNTLEVMKNNEDDQSSTDSIISTNGGLIEMEGQGILIHDLKTQLPTHSMWILRPFVPIQDLILELPVPLVEKLGFGIDIFQNYLISLSDMGIIDEEAVPAPRQVLCRICEQQVPAWWLERHSELCLVEHKLEDEVQECHDQLVEHKKLITNIMLTMATNTTFSPSAASGNSINNNNTKNTTPVSTSSSASTTSSASSFTPIRDYKGLTLPNPFSPSPVNSPSGTSGIMRKKRSSSIFNSLRFPFKNLERLCQYCDDALSINPGELVSVDNRTTEIAYSPNTEKAIKAVYSAKLPESSDPAIKLLTEDTELYANKKTDAIERLASTMQYSEKLKREIDLLILETVHSTVRKIREKTTGISEYNTPSLTQTEKFEDNDIDNENAKLCSPQPIKAPTNSNELFTDPYLYGDKLPLDKTNTKDSSSSYTPTLKSKDHSRSITPNEVVQPRNKTPTIQINLGDRSNSSSNSLNTPPVTLNNTETDSENRGRKAVNTASRSSYASPRRQMSPAAFSNSPMTSIQRNSRTSQKDNISTSHSSTPVASPLLASYNNELQPQQSLVQRTLGNTNSHTHSNSVRYNNLLSLSSSAKPPLSPLLVTSSINKQIVPSIKDYEIIKPISKGAFGSVYLTRRKLTGEYFAIKVLKKSDMIAKNQVPNVKAERAIMMRQAESPYVARLYSSFQSKDYLFLVMEYLNGGDCAALIKMLGSLSDAWAKRYIAEVIVGVDDLHKKGIIHRDLKPDNLLIDNMGHLKLTDFGLSRMGLIGRQTNLRRNSIPETSNVFETVQQQISNHSRTNSVTPFSLSPNIERAQLATTVINSSNPETASNLGSSSPSTPSNFFEQIARSEKTKRSDSNASSSDSPLLKPLISRTNSQTYFALPDDYSASANIQENSLLAANNPLALFDPQNSTQTRKFVGTPDYLAPETVEGVGQDELSDWWSIGCILFEFLFGYPPFHATTANKVFANIVNGRIDWPDLPQEEFDKICSPEAKDLITKLLVKDPSKRLGVNGSEEIMNHPYFKGVNWERLWDEEASFVPLSDDPTSTDYFDSRGAEFSNFPIVDDEDDDEDEEEAEKEADSLDFSSATKISTPNALNISRSSSFSSPANKFLQLPLKNRERRSSKLNENNSNEFGSFQFRNLAALEKANKDVINKLKSENLERRSSISASSSSPESLSSLVQPSRSGGYSSHVNPNRRPTSPSSLHASGGSNTPTRSSFSTQQQKTQPHQAQSRSTDTGSPVPKLAKQFGKSQPLYPTQQYSPQNALFTRALNRTLSDFSPSSSDNEDSRNSAIMRVRSRRSSRRLGSASSNSTNEAIRPSLITYDVLLCEPIPILRETVQKMLAKLGCIVVAIKDGDALVRRATGEVKFDFIFTALRTPKVNSIDVVKLIKHTSSVNSDTPIIALTAYYREAKNSNVFNYVIEKPVTIEMLSECIQKFSEQRRRNAQEAISDTEA